MKHLRFILSLIAMLFVMCFQASAQNNGYMLDTLESSSSVDTVYLYPGFSSDDQVEGDDDRSKFFAPGGNLAVYYQTDSLSGATAATMLLQFGHTDDPDIWYDDTSVTLNGAASQKALITESPFLFNRWRIRAITASGTQNTKIQVSWAYDPE